MSKSSMLLKKRLRMKLGEASFGAATRMMAEQRAAEILTGSGKAARIWTADVFAFVVTARLAPGLADRLSQDSVLRRRMTFMS